MKVLCLGHAAYDITIPFNGFPVENTKNRVDNRVECGGGPAANAAYLLAKWGIETYFAGIVGKDLYGDNIKRELDQIGVNTKYLEQSSNFSTTSSFIIANVQNGSRTILTYRPSDMVMSDFDLDFEPNFILVDGQEIAASNKILDKFPKAISIIDAGRPTTDIIALAKKVDYVVCSKDFAEAVSNMKVNYSDLSTITSIYRKLQEEFKNKIIITLEAIGAAYEDDGKVKIMPSLKMHAVDTTGAGDIFHGAFTYGLLKGFNIEDTVRYANLAGAMSVTHIGSKNSIPDIKDMERQYNAYN